MNKVITKITYNGQEMSIYIPSLNVTPKQFFSHSKTISSFIDSTGFYTKLRPATFNDQSNITDLFLPKLRNLEPLLFRNCYRLDNLNIPNMSVVPSEAFRACSYIYDTVNFDNVIKVESYGFSGASMVQISLPNCLEIGQGGFASCIRMEDIDLPNCEILGNGAFNNCFKLKSISLNVSNISPDCFADCSSLSIVNLPNCTEISYNAFSKCSSLSSINCPNCEKIGTSAFYGCAVLTELSFDKVTEIQGNAFAWCTNLSKLTFTTKSSYNIGTNGNAFNACTNLKELICNATDFNVWSSIYFPSSNIERVIMPYLSSFIANYQFMNLPKLKEVNFDSLSSFNTSINLFAGCSALEKISLPNLTTLGSSAFKNCNALSQAIFTYGKVLTMNNSACFQNTPIDNSSYLGYYGSIYVPSRLVEHYKVATNWVKYSDRITSIENLPSQI